MLEEGIFFAPSQFEAAFFTLTYDDRAFGQDPRGVFERYSGKSKRSLELPLTSDVSRQAGNGASECSDRASAGCAGDGCAWMRPPDSTPDFGVHRSRRPGGQLPDHRSAAAPVRALLLRDQGRCLRSRSG